MASATFKGGVHFHDFKDLTSEKEVVDLVAPEKVIIPLDQHIGVSSKALVKPGDRVLVGQKIGEADGQMSVPVHSSVSGEVVEITEITKVDGFRSKAIVIQSDGTDELGYEEKTLDYQNMSREEIISYIKEGGIVGLGGAAFPTHIKLNTGDRKVDTILLNGSECEPFLTSDQKVMELYPKEIVQGVEVMLKATNAGKAIICIEDNKPRAIGKMQEACKSKSNIEVLVTKTKYPQGDERMLIETALHKEVPKGGLPLDIGVVVSNVYTAKAISDVFYRNRPLYEKIVTVAGSGLNANLPLRVRIGSPISYLIEHTGGLTNDCKKIIMGGPMMGDGQYTLDSPVIKGMSGLLAFTEEEARIPEESQCINCCKCVDVCPVYLEPNNLSRYIRHNDVDACRDSHIDACVQCGSCTYVCPAKINLASDIKVGISEVKRQKARI